METPRIVALTSAGVPLNTTFARLVDALRRAGAEVRPVPVPSGPHSAEDPLPPRLADLKAGLQSLAQQVGDAIRGVAPPADTTVDWLSSMLAAVEGPVTGVVATDPRVAARVFPTAGRVWPAAVRIAVDGDFHIDPEWARVEMDEFITPHPTLGADLARVRERRARLSTGGPIVGGASIQARQVDPALAQLVVSFARLEAGDVDPLLLQLSLVRPGGTSLLLLPSGRPGIDELVRTRAGGYGLVGRRPRAGADPEPWIRGAALLIGRPSPLEAAAAVAARVPQVFFTQGAPLDGGDAFLVQHGMAVHANAAITVAVEAEALLPGGAARAAFDQAAASLELDSVDGCATAILSAAAAGRPKAPDVSALPPTPENEELEIIGGETHAAPAAMNDRVRRAYVREIILQQRDLEKQLIRARSGRDTWKRRAVLASQAGDAELQRAASTRAEGLERIVTRLGERLRDVEGLRERVAGRHPVSAADREAASRLLTAETVSALDSQHRSAENEAFDRLELNDQLARLKRKMNEDS
ncbi:MAG: hypothetical protein R3F39_18655 [Myxococcota bacterium]